MIENRINIHLLSITNNLKNKNLNLAQFKDKVQSITHIKIQKWYVILFHKLKNVLKSGAKKQSINLYDKCQIYG